MGNSVGGGGKEVGEREILRKGNKWNLAILVIKVFKPSSKPCFLLPILPLPIFPLQPLNLPQNSNPNSNTPPSLYNSIFSEALNNFQTFLYEIPTSPLLNTISHRFIPPPALHPQLPCTNHHPPSLRSLLRNHHPGLIAHNPSLS